ncbi:hypothetical protein P389DRAFT_198487 [Cystobasidium minutum MCA 4210]|uniref:uncharacterized protein n=1 Tax=Cystobasidium minutum MCA 4210 TaxID=1397322 RepID=UPI0034CE77BA|eukprot:jgi/Rhomi1/198487/gm1.6701_g
MATLANHGTEDFAHYGKALPPEWTTGEPYCPFASDVYQIAGMWKALFWFKGDRTLGLAKLWEHMMCQNAADRPTMTEAVSLLTEYRQSLKEEELTGPVEAFSVYRATHG